MTPVRTLLAVHAHPDDETITMGGTLARYSAEGVRTIVVTCTHGDLGEVHDPALLVDPDAGEATGDWRHDRQAAGDSLRGRWAAVGSLRERELAAAARVLGISRLVNLGYADSGMAGWPENDAAGAFWAAPLEEAAERLAVVIRDERPQVVVSYDATGGYGHPDHVKSHLVAVAAIEASGAARPAKLYFVRFPLGWSRDFVRSLRKVGIDTPGSAPAGADAGPDVREIGTPDELVTTAIDVRARVPTKLAALARHASQMPPEHFLRRLPPDLAQRLWATEFYSREYGPTAALPGEPETDLFSGLVWPTHGEPAR